LKTRGCNWAP